MVLILSFFILPFTYLSFLFLINRYCPIYKNSGLHFSFYEFFYYVQALIYITYYFFLKFNELDSITIQENHRKYQKKREFHKQKSALVKACLHQLQYKQLKSNWTNFTSQEYLIGCLFSVIVIIPITILILSTSITIGLPFTLTTLISIISLLHVIWGVFDMYDTTSQYNIYIRIFIGLVVNAAIVIPLFIIPRSYHLVYSEISTVVYAVIILLASYTRGQLGYRLYPVDSLVIHDLLPKNTSEEDTSLIKRSQAYLPPPPGKSNEFYTSYYYQNGNIVCSIYGDDDYYDLPSKKGKNNRYAAGYSNDNNYLVPPSQSPPSPSSSSPLPFTSTSIPIYNAEDDEEEENPLRLIQVMRVACIFFALYYVMINIFYGSTTYMSVALVLLIFFFYSDIFKNIDKLQGMLIFWGSLLFCLGFSLFIVNMPFLIHSKKYPNLIMRIDQSITEELPLLNRTTVNGFYTQNKVKIYLFIYFFFFFKKIKIKLND